MHGSRVRETILCLGSKKFQHTVESVVHRAVNEMAPVDGHASYDKITVIFFLNMRMLADNCKQTILKSDGRSINCSPLHRMSTDYLLTGQSVFSFRSSRQAWRQYKVRLHVTVKLFVENSH